MSDVTPTAQDPENKEFASFLGEVLEGAEKKLSTSLQFFVDQIKTQHGQHQKLVESIQKVEQQGVQLKTQALKLEGSLEQGVAAAKHFWLQDKGATDSNPKAT